MGDAAPAQQESGWLGAGGTATATATAVAPRNSWETPEVVDEVSDEEFVEDWVDDVLDEEPLEEDDDFDFGEKSSAGPKILALLIMVVLVGVGGLMMFSKDPAVAVDPGSKADTLLVEAKAHQEKGNLKAAIAKAQEALKGKPSANEKAEAFTLIAASRFTLKDYKGSKEAYAMLPPSEERDAGLKKAEAAWDKQQRIKANGFMGDAKEHFNQGNFEDSARSAQLAVGLYTEHGGSNAQTAAAYAMVARSSLKFDDLPAAESNAKKATNLDSRYKNLLADIRGEIARRAPKKAPATRVVVKTPKTVKRYPSGRKNVRKRPVPKGKRTVKKRSQPKPKSEPRVANKPPKPKPKPAQAKRTTTTANKSSKWVPISQRNKKIKGL